MIRFLVGCLLVSACFCLISVVVLVIHSTANEDAIAASALTLPAIADRHLVSLQAETLKLVDAHAKNLEASVNGAVRTADNRLAGIQGVAEEQLTAATRELATVTRVAAVTIPETASSITKSIASISQDVHQVAVPIAGTAAQLNDAAPLYLDCEFNPDCAFNRFQGTSKAIELTMQTVAKAAPQIAQSAVSIEGSAKSIAGDFAKEVHEFTKPKRWWQRLEDFLKVGGTIAAHAL